MQAVDFFHEHYFDEAKEISKVLQGVEPPTQLHWESTSVHPELSPGPVHDDEVLCRPMINPVHYDTATGMLKPTAFDDCSSIGLSVDRLAHVTTERSLQKARARVTEYNARPDKKLERSLVGHTVLSVAAVRSVVALQQLQRQSELETRRALGVYDTSLDGEPEHADVLQLVPGKQAGRSARRDLFELGNRGFIKLEDN